MPTETRTRPTATKAPGGPYGRNDPPAGRYANPADLLADVVSSRWAMASDAAESKARLRDYATETGGGATMANPAGVNLAGFVGPEWTEPEYAVRVPASVYVAIGARPIPDKGQKLVTPRITTGASSDTTAEAAEATSANLAADMKELDVNTATAEVTVTIQGYERGALEEAILIELDQAVTEDIDAKIVTAILEGTYTAGAVSVTSGNKAYNKLWPLIVSAKRTVHDNLKRPPRDIVMAPRRWELFDKEVDASGPFLKNQWDLAGMYPTVTSAIPENLGTGTNQDAIIVSDLREHRLYSGPLQVLVDFQADASDLEVTLTGYKYWAYSPEVRPEATVLLTGAGLT